MNNKSYLDLDESTNDENLRDYHFKRIVNEVTASSYSDLEYFERNIFRFKNYYLRKEVSSETNTHIATGSTLGRRDRSRDSETLTSKKTKLNTNSKDNSKSKAKDSFKRTFGYSQPWIDLRLRTHISRTNPDSIPRGTVETRDEIINAADIEGSRTYSKTSRRPSRLTTRTYTGAGIRAAKDLGFSFGTVAWLQKTLSVKESINGVIKNTNSGWPTYQKKSSDLAIADTTEWLLQALKKPSFRNSIGLNPILKVESKRPRSHYNKDFGPSVYDSEKFREEFNLLDLPLTLFHRFQIKLDENLNFGQTGIRQVWCVPFRIIALENMFFGNILKNVQNKNISTEDPNYSSGLNNSQISSRLVERIRKHSYNSNNCMHSVDYKKFDRTIPDWAMDIFFSIIGDILELTPRKRKLFNFLRLYMKYTPYIFEGDINFMKRGIPSGALITNLFDSWWNLTIWYVCDAIEREGTDVTDDFIFGKSDIYNYDVISGNSDPNTDIILHNIGVCGDDVLISARTKTIQLHSRVCMSMDMVAVAQEPRRHDEDVFFLGRYWDSNNRPFQSFRYMSSHIITRNKWYKKDEAPFDISTDLDLYRALSICLPFKNGMEYLLKTFSDWKPFSDFMKGRKGFYLLKDWPRDEFIYYEHQAAINYKTY